jgi:hypothetical protein
MEQNRAPSLFFHFIELAWSAAAGLRDDRQIDRFHHDRKGLESDMST